MEIGEALLDEGLNLGGQINEISNKRVWIGLFPLRGIELESSMCRIVAWLPPKTKAAKKAKKK